jgi:hypothetical protein
VRRQHRVEGGPASGWRINEDHPCHVSGARRRRPGRRRPRKWATSTTGASILALPAAHEVGSVTGGVAAVGWLRVAVAGSLVEQTRASPMRRSAMGTRVSSPPIADRKTMVGASPSPSHHRWICRRDGHELAVALKAGAAGSNHQAHRDQRGGGRRADPRTRATIVGSTHRHECTGGRSLRSTGAARPATIGRMATSTDTRVRATLGAGLPRVDQIEPTT